jgi:GNAT superfamily N-acetyltransferase
MARKYNVRQAELEDAATIARVHVESWRSTYAGIVSEDVLSSLDIEARIENWKEWLLRGDLITLVTEDNTGIFGFAGGGPLREEPAGYDAEIYAIYLLQQYQKQGAGADLFRRLAIELKKQDFKSAAVWVLEKNSACAFYFRLGGVPVMQKPIEIGGQMLEEIAYGWQNLDVLTQ